jgi:hypothetical protein
MKNMWLRAEEQAAVKPTQVVKPRCRQLQVRDRPHVASDGSSYHRRQTAPSNIKKKSSPETPSSHVFGIRKDMVSEVIRKPYQSSDQRTSFWINSDSSTERKLLRAKKLLAGVMKRECTAHDGIPKPANHVVRNIEKIEHPHLQRSRTIPRFSFIDDDFLTFGTFDVVMRPGWDESLLISADEKIAENRRNRVKLMKEKLVELNAIIGTVKDVMVAYSGDGTCYIKDHMVFAVPIYLNNHEMHAWRTVSNLLYTYGQSFSLGHMEQIADLCGSNDAKDNSKIDMRKFRFQHPEIYHFVCYCNLLLGGSKSFISARFMLLRDLSMLLKLIRQVR